MIDRYDPPRTGTHQAVMVVHGGVGPDGDWRRSGIVESLVAKNYSVFIPHYFDGPGGKWNFKDNPDQFVAFIRTLDEAARYISQQAGIDSKGIGLVGLSLGGYLALGLAEEERSHPPKQHSPGIRAVAELYGGIPEFAISRMTSMPPVLIVHGQNDEIVPVSRAHEVEQVLKKKGFVYEIKIYQDQGHTLSGDALEDANLRVAYFISQHLH